MTATAMVRFTDQFEGKEIRTMTYQGQPIWPAVEIGRSLGYGVDGSNFVRKVTGAWSEELEGAVVRQSFDTSESEGSTRGGFRGEQVFLTERGIWTAAMLSRKPAGQRLRRWLASEVLPKLARGQVVGPRRGAGTAAEALRKSTEQLHKRQQLDERQYILALIEVMELATGRPRADLRQAVEQQDFTLPPKQAKQTKPPKTKRTNPLDGIPLTLTFARWLGWHAYHRSCMTRAQELLPADLHEAFMDGIRSANQGQGTNNRRPCSESEARRITRWMMAR